MMELVPFCARFLGIDLPAIVAVTIAFLLNTSSYYGEIVRAGIESVARGQREAARSTGLTAAQTMVYVILPQAIRTVVPTSSATRSRW
jgi:polar amino acid transport system permease protein